MTEHRCVVLDADKVRVDMAKFTRPGQTDDKAALCVAIVVKGALTSGSELVLVVPSKEALTKILGGLLEEAGRLWPDLVEAHAAGCDCPPEAGVAPHMVASLGAKPAHLKVLPPAKRPHGVPRRRRPRGDR